MICPSCKKVYNNDDVFCVECGTRLINENETPIERFSTRVKSSKNNNHVEKPKTKRNYIPPNDNKLDILIIQNKELIKQNKRIIELLEKIAG